MAIIHSLNKEILSLSRLEHVFEAFYSRIITLHPGNEKGVTGGNIAAKTFPPFTQSSRAKLISCLESKVLLTCQRRERVCA
jgi:hypothetical protein